MADMEFAVAKRRTKPITFTLEGEDHTYSFKPPKSAVMLMPILETVTGSEAEANLSLTKATFDWLGKGLKDSDNKRILSRLQDDDDDLDVDTLSDVVQGLSERVAARPTT